MKRSKDCSGCPPWRSRDHGVQLLYGGGRVPARGEGDRHQADRGPRRGVHRAPGRLRRLGRLEAARGNESTRSTSRSFARNAKGFRNLLLRLSVAPPSLERFLLQAAHRQGDPRRWHAEGLICLSPGCASAEVLRPHPARQDGPRRERASSAWYQKIFGEENFLRRDPGQRRRDPESATATRRGALDIAAANGPARRRHERRPLPDPRGRRGPRRPALHQHGHDAR